MAFYEQLCEVSSRIPLSRLAGRGDNRELEKAVVFLASKMRLTVDGIKSASILSGLLTLIGVAFLLVFLALSVLVSIPLSLMAAVLVYYVVISYPVSLMNSYKLTLSEEADLIFEQFLLVFQSGGTIFDAIEMVAAGNHPLLSDVFKGMLAEIDSGTPPETCLSEFAKNQPSDDLRRYLLAIISSLEQKTDLLESLSGESFEADMTLRQKNLEIESRLLIVAALVTYLPIMFTLAISLSGYATDLIVLLIAPLFVGINALLRIRFSRSFSAYFDQPHSSSLSPPSQTEIIKEYDEFLNFMILLGERLRMGDTLEVALPEVRNDVAGEVQRLIDPAIESVYWKSKSIDEAMALAIDSSLGQRVANLLGMIVKMCEMSAKDSGARISRIASRLVKRSAVVKERDSIIAAQRLKVYILSITSSAVLGLLTSLAPFLFIGQLISGTAGMYIGEIAAFDILPLIVGLGITTASTGYQNTKMVGGTRGALVGFLCLLLFLASFMLSSTSMDLGLL